MRIVVVLSLLFFAFYPCTGALAAEPNRSEIAESVRVLEQVGPEGAGHRAAQAAWKKLAALDATNLPALTGGARRCRAAGGKLDPRSHRFDRGAQRTAGEQLPTAAIEDFLRDRKHAPRTRRLAFELLAAADPAAPDRWIPQMLDDPSLELRRDAVSRLIDQAGRWPEKGRPMPPARPFGRRSARPATWIRSNWRPKN